MNSIRIFKNNYLQKNCLFEFKGYNVFMFKKCKDLFGVWNWFEILLIISSFMLSITLTIVFKSAVLDCITFILVALNCILLAKGKVFGHFVGIISTTLYIVVSLNAQYYGEVLLSALVVIPMSIWCIIEWLKNKRDDKEQGGVVIVNKLSLKEILLTLLFQLIITVGLYFLLQVFNTKFLIFSTIAASLTIAANYLVIRRSELNWIAWIAKSISAIILWLHLTIYVDISYITMTAMAFFTLITNSYGFINWINFKKMQKNLK